MTITVDIMPDLDAELARQAASHGEVLEAYATSLLKGAVNAPANKAVFARASTLDWAQCPAVESVPEKVGGAWVFRNTRMPVAVVFENLEDGVTIDELVEMYAGLTREQIASVLDFAARSLATRPIPAR